jgi:hypothetical protein
MTDFELTTLEYLRDCVRRGLREATIKYYRDVLERFSRVSAITQLSQLTRGSIQDFQDELAELSPGSVKGFVSASRPSRSGRTRSDTTWILWLVSGSHARIATLSSCRPTRNSSL